MKQFNLEEYLKNSQKKVITREGLSARIICTDRKGYNTKPIIALVTISNGTEVPKSYWEDGVNAREYGGNPDDLFFAPVKKSGWIILYRVDSITTLGAQVYNTEEEAKSAAGDKSYSIATIKIEWEE